MADPLTYMGSLRGHGGAVTSLATPLDPKSDILLSSSRYDDVTGVFSRLLVVWYWQLCLG